MLKKEKIFISSVQAEFKKEREMLFDYITNDPLLGRFFEPFVFEKFPAADISVSDAYIKNVEESNIYLGIFGKDYGYEDKEGISPTEREFDHAKLHSRTKLVFLSDHNNSERHPKEAKLIKKAEQFVVRKQFSSIIELKSAVYSSLIRYLEENEYIRTVPFDAEFNKKAEFDDLDSEKIRSFIRTARGKRKIPFKEDEPFENVLTHLSLIDKGRITNAAILLFGHKPQRFFITSEIRCAHFHGTDTIKPIPSYQVYKGDVFQLVDQAVDFVLSKIDVSTGDRSKSVVVPVHYEIPPAAVAEAIVNAVAHRDYTSNGSVQVMLFKDRLEIWNPGTLPYGLTPAKLKEPHNSIPGNPLLAEPMYLAGYIERMGTGTREIVKLCKKESLKEPEFIQEEMFRTVIWRKSTLKQVTTEVSGQATQQATQKVTQQVTQQVKRLLSCIKDEMSRAEIMEMLGLRDRNSFFENYLIPALTNELIEMTQPDSPNSPTQKYRLTEKGKKVFIKQ